MTEEPDKPENEEPEKPEGEASGKPANEAPRIPRRTRKARKPESEGSEGAKKTSSEAPAKPASRRIIWVRGFYMLLMLLVWQFAEAVLVAVTIVQFIFNLVGEPNERLTAFGDSLATYLQQIARFLTYASDELPFPFADWPAKV